MGVVTTADSKLNSAADHVKEALEDLSEIVIGECWGHDDFRKEYRAEIQFAFNMLLDVKSRLDR